MINIILMLLEFITYHSNDIRMEVMQSSVSVCLSVCSSVNRITQEIFKRFAANLVHYCFGKN